MVDEVYQADMAAWRGIARTQRGVGRYPLLRHQRAGTAATLPFLPAEHAVKSA